MSNIIKNAYDNVPMSQFNIVGDENSGVINEIEIRNAQIFWTNFAGKENQFGNAARYFNVAISDELADILVSQGFNVKSLVVNPDDPDVLLKFIQVKINMESEWPPMVKLFTEFQGKKNPPKTLNANTIGSLDGMDILRADLNFRAYRRVDKRTKQQASSAYLKRLFVIQNPLQSNTYYGDVYNEYPDEVYSDINEDLPFNNN